MSEYSEDREQSIAQDARDHEASCCHEAPTCHCGGPVAYGEVCADCVCIAVVDDIIARGVTSPRAGCATGIADDLEELLTYGERHHDPVVSCLARSILRKTRALSELEG
jgi:hypothetical protein